jgi:uncharacterized protein YuzE
MQIQYNAKTDLLYIRLDDRKQDVVNRCASEDIVLDIGEGNRIVVTCPRLLDHFGKPRASLSSSSESGRT